MIEDLSILLLVYFVIVSYHIVLITHVIFRYNLCFSNLQLYSSKQILFGSWEERLFCLHETAVFKIMDQPMLY